MFRRSRVRSPVRLHIVLAYVYQWNVAICHWYRNLFQHDYEPCYLKKKKNEQQFLDINSFQKDWKLEWPSKLIVISPLASPVCADVKIFYCLQCQVNLSSGGIFRCFFFRCFFFLHQPMYAKRLVNETYVNSADPDEAPHNTAPHQGLHYLLEC